PKRDTSPYVGFIPTTPQNAAGWRIEPPVSEPSANFTCPAATAAAGPPLDPPGTWSVFQGLRVDWKLDFSLEEPMANSSIFNFPIVTAPAPLSFSTAVALNNGSLKFFNIWLPAVVFNPFVIRLSLSPAGMPNRRCDLSVSLSSSCAFSKDISSFNVKNACTCSSVSL